MAFSRGFHEKASLNPDIPVLLSRNKEAGLVDVRECRLTIDIDFYTLASRIGARARREGNYPSLAQAVLDLMLTVQSR